MRKFRARCASARSTGKWHDLLSDPLTHLPPPILWNGWEADYHIMRYEGDPSASVN